MANELIKPEEVTAIKKEAEPLLEFVKGLNTIEKPEEYKIVGEMAFKFKTGIKTVKSKFDPIVKQAYQTHKSIKALMDELLEPLNKGLTKCSNAMIDYDEREKQKQLELQRQIDKEAEIARKKIEDERLKQAIKLEEKGDKYAAEKLMNAPINIPIAKIEKETPKVSGISYRENWYAKVTDIDLIPREYLIPDMQKLNALARATKGESNIPGVKFYSEKAMATRT